MIIKKKNLLNTLDCLLRENMPTLTSSGQHIDDDKIVKNRIGDNYDIAAIHMKAAKDDIKEDCQYLIGVLKKRYGANLTPELELDLTKIMNAIVDECQKKFTQR